MEFIKKEPEIITIVPPVHISRIKDWASAIQHEEGFFQGSRSFRNNNPGNLKLTDYTKSLGASGVDKNNFCIFPTFDKGMQALCQFLTDACNNKLKPYRNCSLLQFTKIYALPPNDNYANGVALALNVSVDIKIKELL
jgi:hypothetical protein